MSFWSQHPFRQFAGEHPPAAPVLEPPPDDDPPPSSPEGGSPKLASSPVYIVPGDPSSLDGDPLELVLLPLAPESLLPVPGFRSSERSHFAIPPGTDSPAAHERVTMEITSAANVPVALLERSRM
jgi:hypothetical protein